MPARRHGGQLALFPVVEAAEPSSEVSGLAAALPAEVRLGTSSWSFPGWAGVVYDRRASESDLARHGLAAYARHPLLRAVGIDRTFYGPLAAAEFRAYADVVPEDFRFVVKAHRDCTRGTAEGRRADDFPRFLDAGYATDAVVAPLVEGLGSRLASLVFQFEPQPKGAIEPPEFATRLHRFLSGLPPLPKTAAVAVEIRNREWLTPEYADALADVGATHCLSLHPRLPSLAEQCRVAAPALRGPLTVRWNLHAGHRYASAKARYAPFDRLVDPDPATRHEIGSLAAEAARTRREVTITINNKAEGSAPISALRLGEEIVRQLEPGG